MHRLVRFLVVIAGVFAISAGIPSQDAWAKGKADRIEKVGIKSIDSVFKEVDDLDDRVRTAQKRRKSGRDEVATAVGFKEGTPLADSLAELNRLAGGKLKVAMKGAIPVLEASDAVPSNVKNAVTAVNNAMSDYTEAIQNLQAVPTECQQLYKEAQKFPQKMKKEFSNMSLADLPDKLKSAKALKNNIAITAGIPKRAKKVTKGLKKDIAMVKATFGG